MNAEEERKRKEMKATELRNEREAIRQKNLELDTNVRNLSNQVQTTDNGQTEAKEAAQGQDNVQGQIHQAPNEGYPLAWHNFILLSIHSIRHLIEIHPHPPHFAFRFGPGESFGSSQPTIVIPARLDLISSLLAFLRSDLQRDSVGQGDDTA